jgi:hypothetical protein
MISSSLSLQSPDLRIKYKKKKQYPVTKQISFEMCALAVASELI